MKINEKNLCGFAVSDSPVDKEGWLLKRGEVNKSFQRRWFTLKGNLLFYFEKKTDKEPSGVIILEGCTIDLAEYEEQYAFKIVFHGAGDRTYVLGADTQETMESWMKALACASYDYMKLMVSELQRQLDDIVELEKAHASIFDDVQPKKRANKPPAGGSQPQAPSRNRRGGSLRKAPPPPTPTQRLNPFDRDSVDVGGNVRQPQQYSSSTSTTTGTPQSKRRLHGNSAKEFIATKDTHSFAVPESQPRQLERSLSLRCESPSTMTASSSQLCRPFFKLHELYGAKIISDVILWNRNHKVVDGESGRSNTGDLIDIK